MDLIKKFMTVILGTALLFSGMMPVHAQEEEKLMQTIVSENDLKIFVASEKEISAATAQIGMDHCEDVTVCTVSDMGEPVNTLIFLDNSLSISEKNQQKIKSFLQSYIAQKYEHEAISLYLFGEEAKEILRDVQDQDELLEAVEEIRYENQVSWLTDAVYDVVKERQGSSVYTRTIVISDGVDKKSIGYTREELQELMKKSGFPMYAIGCVYKENESNLEQFFALSRQTAGQCFLLDAVEDTGEIEGVLLQDANAFCINIPIPGELRDGSEKSVLVKLETESGTVEMQTKAQMPFGEKTELISETETETESEIETESKAETETAAETENMEETIPIVSESRDDVVPVKSGKGADPLTVMAIVMIVAAVLALVILKRKDLKKKQRGEKNAVSQIEMPAGYINRKPEKENDADKEETRYLYDGEETQYIREEEATLCMDDEDRTEMVQDSRGILFCLQDVARPDKIFRYPLFGDVIVGRATEGVHIVLPYDRSVSNRQCKVYRKNGKVYVENLSKSNGTCVNGQEIFRETQIQSGDILTMGRLQMKVELAER